MLNRFLSSVVAATMLVSCGSDTTSLAPTTVPELVLQAAMFSFSEDLLSLTQPGATAQTTVIGAFANGSVRVVTPTCTRWQSDDTSVLTVSNGGLLTAQSSSGSATITTTCQGIVALLVVTLNPTRLPTWTFVTPPSSTCPNPPYQVTIDANGG